MKNAAGCRTENHAQASSHQTAKKDGSISSKVKTIGSLQMITRHGVIAIPADYRFRIELPQKS